MGGVQAILMEMRNDGDREVTESQSIMKKISEITNAMEKWQ